MAKLTMLDMVQDILNDMDGDEVNTISDTIEAEQIAQIIKTTFDALMSEKDWAHTRGLVKMIASGDSSLPTHMTFNEDFKRIVKVNYNKIKTGETRLQYLPVRYRNSDDFLRMLNARDSTADNIDIITDPSGITLLVRNDIAPEFYTSFDEETLVFDSYDSVVDTTLQSSKTQCIAFKMPVIVIADDHIPDLPSEAFTLLLEESKSRAQLKLRQTQDVKAEQAARKAGSIMSRQDWVVNGGIRYKSYGRHRTRTPVTPKETYQNDGI